MHSISPYLVTSYDKALSGPIKERYRALDDIRGLNLIDLIEEFTTFYSKKFHEVERKEKKSFKFSSIKKSKNQIHGYMEFGTYGNASEIHNMTSGGKMYDKKPDDSDIQKFFFIAKIFPKKKKGFIFFQNVHGNGIKSEFHNKLNDFYEKKTSGLKLQINPFTNQQILSDWYENANVKEIKILDYKAGSSQDLADQMSESVAEVRFKPKKRKATFGSLKGIRNKKDIITLMSQYGKSVSAVAELNGKKRTFSLSKSGEPLSAIEIDDSVEMINGNPSFQSITKLSNELMDDFESEIN